MAFIKLCYLQNGHFVDFCFFSVCDVKTILCKYSKDTTSHVHGYDHFHYAGLTCTIIKVSEIFYAERAAWCLWLRLEQALKLSAREKRAKTTSKKNWAS